MLILRNVAEHDLDAVFELAQGVGPGMTTLKADRGALRQRIAVACASFAGDIPPHEADYLFVLEDTEQMRVCGISAIKAAVGMGEPFYNFRLSTSVHASPSTGVVHRVQSLHLTHDLSGASELCSLYLDPRYRHGVNGKLLSKGRFLFIAQFPELFAPTIFAEMRGLQDADGTSPFWESVGRPFFKMDFDEADDLCGSGDRLFIEQLVPRHPLYTHLLGADARAAIGQTHRDTVPARRLLEQEGLRYDGYIDIFDGGPVLRAAQPDLRAAWGSILRPAVAGMAAGGTVALLASTRQHDFRVIVAHAQATPSAMSVEEQALEALGCAQGELLRVLPLHPTIRGTDPWPTNMALSGNG